MNNEQDKILDKVFLVDKPADVTSHDVVNVVRRMFGTRKVGHAGTLDPFATGLLILGIGRATKKLTGFLQLNKTYVAKARLGAVSTTYDLEGEITENNVSLPSKEVIKEVLMGFLGDYSQKAPAFSAKKVKGKKLYELARAGENVEKLRPTKMVHIFNIEFLSYDKPFLEFKVTCSSGTYIRSLANDLGEKLGCGAYLVELRRIEIGDFSVNEAEKIDIQPRKIFKK